MSARPAARCLRSQKCRHRRCIRRRARLTGCIMGLKITCSWNHSTCTNSWAVGEVMLPEAGVNSASENRERGGHEGSRGQLESKGWQKQLGVKEEKKCLSDTVTVFASQFWVSNNSHRWTKRLNCIYKWTSSYSLLTFWQADYRAVKQQEDSELWRKARKKSLPDRSFALKLRPDPVPHQHLARQVAPPWGSCCQRDAITASQTRGFRHEPPWSRYRNSAATVTIQPSDTLPLACHYKSWICLTMDGRLSYL